MSSSTAYNHLPNNANGDAYRKEARRLLTRFIEEPCCVEEMSYQEDEIVELMAVGLSRLRPINPTKNG